MGFFADLHIHSKYSRATSKEMNLDGISTAAKMKGIKLMGTGDFTHPEWLKELEEKLQPVNGNLYIYKDVYYMLTAEVSNVYEKNGRTYKIHNIIFAPDFEKVKEINKILREYGDLSSDGRPQLSLDSKIMLKRLSEIDGVYVAPAHVWTPWFSLFGANSGFDSIDECFEEYTDKVLALETGLSSDPPMNWRLSSLDRFALISNSDAHSPQNIGREANYFNCELNYWEIMKAIKNKDKEKFGFTVEFFPEEGKYHYDGHRKCGIRVSPKEAEATNCICPKCGKRLTIGVLHRVHNLADREEGFVPENAIPYKHLIPLREIIAFATGRPKESPVVERDYKRMIHELGNEFDILLNLSFDEIKHASSEKIAQCVINAREGKVEVIPGYDGVYGEIRIKLEGLEEKKSQMSLF